MFVKGLMTPEKIAFCESVTFYETINIENTNSYRTQRGEGKSGTAIADGMEGRIGWGAIPGT